MSLLVSKIKYFLCNYMVMRMENNSFAISRILPPKDQYAFIFYLISSAESYSHVTDEKRGDLITLDNSEVAWNKKGKGRVS